VAHKGFRDMKKGKWLVAVPSWISVVSNLEGVAVKTPYSPDLVNAWKKLGGKWDAGTKVWTLPQHQVGNVLGILNSQYGFPATREQELCRITVDLSTVDCSSSDTIYLMGRPVMRFYEGSDLPKLEPGCKTENMVLEEGRKFKPGSLLEIIECPKGMDAHLISKGVKVVSSELMIEGDVRVSDLTPIAKGKTRAKTRTGTSATYPPLTTTSEPVPLPILVSKSKVEFAELRIYAAQMGGHIKKLGLTPKQQDELFNLIFGKGDEE
jgi:hypothetical protein